MSLLALLFDEPGAERVAELLDTVRDQVTLEPFTSASAFAGDQLKQLLAGDGGHRELTPAGMPTPRLSG
jgi:hypothetical protein